MAMTNEQILINELLRLMRVKKENSTEYDTSGSDIICRWCHCLLIGGGGYIFKEQHRKDCFASKYLKRPSV